MKDVIEPTSGFNTNFNLLMPLLMADDCSANNDECKKMHQNLMVMMMALQSMVSINNTYLMN